MLLDYKDLEYYPQMMMRLECGATHSHLGLMGLLLPLFHVQFYISGHRLLLSMHILHIVLPGGVVDSHRILEKINGLYIS